VPALAAIGIVTKDMKESVRFYRLLGVEVNDPADDHLDATLPSGLRLMWDTLELIKQPLSFQEGSMGRFLGSALRAGHRPR
jgi:catechol 2,3-dioxygenase-like lactoylglutathione lyase family enzyme